MHSPKSFLLLAVAFVALRVTAAPLWNAKNPEQLQFIAARCMEEWSPKAKDPKAALKNWMEWRLQPSTEEATQCYTKCMLENIGFYEPVEKRLKGVRVMQQWETFNRYQSADREKVHDLTDTFDFIRPLKSSSCSDVFNAYKDVHAKHLETIKAILFCDGKSAEKYYKDKGKNIKQKGQSIVVHCEEIHYPVGSQQRKELCKVRKYEMGTGKPFENLMECIFKGVRYFNDKNELNIDEIARDFTQVGKKPDAVKATMQNCKSKTKETDPGKKAVEYYKCLLADPKLKKDFMEAFDYREIRSKDYYAQITGKLKPYSASDVRKEVDDIDSKQCV
ncbi:37 kDa salivary gland allergen Aed a 2-like [Aedes albopictus]|uniref:Long form D7 salivary protein n=1 Tax=Aedes albopictus TaxID=7160 RepID=A0ABM2A5P1_AEDAL|nr:37 kDa salivary gland allergen Aed a 2-like [Aedes albopictus]